jgi:hypothetical protein
MAALPLDFVRHDSCPMDELMHAFGVIRSISPAAFDISEERLRQICEEGWTPERDDAHANGELATAAASYALNTEALRGLMPGLWPWSKKWWKPKDRRRDLVRAAALLVAEIERLDRKAAGEAI